LPLDPALNHSSVSSHFRTLADLELERGAVYAFDFDGVLISSAEDAIYRLSEDKAELDLLTAAARTFNIRCERMEPRYQRHLLYQAAAWRLQLPLEPGPGLAFAQQANQSNGVAVLTARSGWYAIERVRAFLQFHRITPVDMFQVGRVSKSLQIRLLAEEFAHATVVYVEDALAHLESAAALGLPNVLPVHCPPSLDAHSPEERRTHLEETIRSAMRVW
jgi:HAD superfamily hydrolase (TIGR01509 family)